MDDYEMRLKTSLCNLKVYDPGTTYSDDSYAREILRSSGLSQDQQRHVLSACDATWDSNKIEKQLKMVYAEIHVHENVDISSHK